MKKIISILLSLSMILTMANVFAYTDIEEGTNVSDAVAVLSDLDIIDGYSDGSFKPNNSITRAEMAKIICRTLGYGDLGVEVTPFKDVALNHWAAGYINTMYKLEAIQGYGDDNFGPEDYVSYQDAITMIVRILGYEPAIGSAGYPTGYLTKAGELGLTKGVNLLADAPATRGDVAQLLFNALDVPLMTKVGYGTFTQYVINDGFSSTLGTSNIRKTILSEYHNIFKVQGIVKDSTDSTSTSVTNTDKITFKIENTYANKYSNSALSLGDKKMEVGDSNALNYVGEKCIAFVRYEEFEDVITVISIYSVDVKNSLTIDLQNLETVPNNFVGDYKYYSANDKILTTTISDTASIFINNVEYSQIANVSDYSNIADMSGTITFALLNSNTSADYDTVYINAAEIVVVDEVKISTSTIKNKVSNSIRNIIFDETDGDIKATIVGVNNWTDLAEFDVLMVKHINTGNKHIYEAELVTNTIEGTIDTLSGTRGTDDRIIEVEGIEYSVAAIAEQDKAFNLGDEGIFYLDINDNIVYFDAVSRRSGNYGYVIATKANDNTDINNTNQIKILTKDNDIVIYDVSKTFRYNGVYGSKIEDNTGNILNTSDSIHDLVGTVITYSINSTGKISVINTPIDVAQYPSVDKDKEFTTEVPFGGKLENYDTEDMTFGKYQLMENTVIFAIDSNDVEESEVVAVPVLAEDDELTNVVLYDVDEDERIGAIVVEKTNANITTDTDYAAFVTKVSNSYDKNGNDIIIIEGYKNNELISYVCESSVNIPTIGSLVVPMYNLSGTIKGFYEAGDVINSEKHLSTVRELATIDGRNMTFTVGDNMKPKASVNVYVYDTNANSRLQFKIDESLSYIDYDAEYTLNGTTTGLFRDNEDIMVGMNDIEYSDLKVEVVCYVTEFDEITDLLYIIK